MLKESICGSFFMARIVVDAGHGGEDPGAMYQGRKEKDDNLALAMAVGNILKKNEVDVVYTRTDDVYQTPFQKAQAANQAGADLFLSLHRNSSPENNQYSGVESLVYAEQGIKKELAENINRELEKAGFQNLGIRERPGLVVFRRTKMPAVLVEVGFINTEADNQTLDQNFDAVAQSIADGILLTLRENGLLPGKDLESGTENSTATAQEESMMENDSLGENTENWWEPMEANGERDWESGNPENPVPVRYRVQTGAFRKIENAERLRQRLLRHGFPAEMEPQGDFFLVWSGEFESLDNAAKMEKILRSFGYATYIRTVEDS